ncbi:unnamed protein product, partial [Ectocarpus fasciculatus]
LARESAPAAARNPRDNDGTVETSTAAKNAFSVSASPVPPTGRFSADETTSLVGKTHDDDKYAERPVSLTAPRLSCCVGRAALGPSAAGGAGFQGGAAPPGGGSSKG